MQLTRTSDKLKRSILFDTERRESIFVPPIDSGYFSLLRHKRPRIEHMTVRFGPFCLSLKAYTNEL